MEPSELNPAHLSSSRRFIKYYSLSVKKYLWVGSVVYNHHISRDFNIVKNVWNVGLNFVQ